MASFHFLRPHWLWLLIPAALLIWTITRRGNVRQQWGRFVDSHLLDALMTAGGRRSRLRPWHLLAVIWLLGITALAGPAWHREPAPFSEETAGLVIVLKVTPSMQTSDLQPSRLERSVHKIRDLLAERAGSRTALVAYAGSAHLVMPLTRDAGAIEMFAAALRPELMPREGDNPVSAWSLAEQQLANANQAGSVLFIIDSMSPAEAERLQQQRSSSAAPIVILGAIALETEGPEREQLRQASSTLNAPLEYIAPDDRDIIALTKRVESNLSAVANADGSQRWRDEGYWLTPLLCALALMWFRPGWMVSGGGGG